MAANNRFRRRLHDEYIECPSCDERNAPRNSNEYSSRCWKCGEKLDTVSVGSVRNVDIVDEREDGIKVGKTSSGLIVFIDSDSTLEETVEITEMYENYAVGKITEKEPEKLEKPAHSEYKPSLGSRDEF